MYENELDLDPENFAKECFQFHNIISSRKLPKNLLDT